MIHKSLKSGAQHLWFFKITDHGCKIKPMLVIVIINIMTTGHH